MSRQFVLSWSETLHCTILSMFIFEWTEPVKTKQNKAIVVIYILKKTSESNGGASALLL